MATNSNEQFQRIEFFIKCLSDPDPQIRGKAVTILGNCGAEIAIPELEKLVTNADENIQVRLKAMDAIVSIAKLELITSMSEQPKNQPTFNIGQVGNINTGDVTVQRDQIGVQNNYDTAPEIVEVMSNPIAIKKSHILPAYSGSVTNSGEQSM